MKKLALLLVLTMLATAIALPAMAETQMDVAWWGNQTRNERTQAALDLYTQNNEGITIDSQMNAWGDYWEALATAAAGNSLPDVLQMDYGYLQQYVENKLLVDLTPYIEDGTLDVSNVSQGIMDSGSMDGKVYAICLGENSPALLYNKTLLDANGITVKDNMTLDEFIALCKEVYEKTGYKSNLCYGSADGFLKYLVRADDTAMYSDGGFGISQDQLANFFSIYEQGYNEGWLLGSEVFAEISVGSVEQDPLVYGSDPANMSWCAFFWSNQTTAVQNAAPEGVEVGITTWPSPDPVKSDYLKPSQFFSVSAQSQNQAEAVKIVNYFLNSVECNDILLGERGIPASSVVAAAIAPQLDEINQKVVSFINDVVTPNCSAVPVADPTGSTELNTVINDMIEQICYGATSASDAAANVADEASSIFAK